MPLAESHRQHADRQICPISSESYHPMNPKRPQPWNDTTLGGQKPTMLHGGIDVFVNYKNARKSGYYESSSDRSTLARRVELPAWMDQRALPKAGTFLEALQSGKIHIPAAHTKERHGHILWNSAEFGLEGPAVGVDEEIFRDWVEADSCAEVVFVVYLHGKTELERWRISKEQFAAACKRVATSSSFVPQFMVSVKQLTPGGETASQAPSNPFGNL